MKRGVAVANGDRAARADTEREEMYDAIIVGARCAGSPTAMLLARKGYRVLLVDKASFPSDTISTHIIWPHGAEIMDRWGLLDRLAATGCPPIALNMTFDVGPFALKGGVTDTNGGRGGFCPRRTVLDKLLVDAAVESGAELREEFTVEDLVWAGDQVGRDQGPQPERRQRGGAGTNGHRGRRCAFVVAKVVGAPEYDAIPPLATFYYSYYSGFEAEDIEQYVGATTRAPPASRRNDGLTLIAAVWPSEQFQRDTLRHRRERQEGARVNTKRRRQAAACTSVRRNGSERRASPNYFRKPYGPGWALVGDAGYDKDPITAQGISDAFIDAENLTEALDAGFSGAAPAR